MVAERTAGCPRRPHENASWAKRGIEQIYWRKGQHLRTDRERSKSVGWNRSGAVRPEEQDAQMKLMRDAFNNEFAASSHGDRAASSHGDRASHGDRVAKAKVTKEKNQELKDQERNAKLAKMDEGAKKTFLLDAEWKAMLAKYNAIIGAENKIQSEFQRLKIKYGKLHAQHSWLPISKMQKCEATLKKLKARVPYIYMFCFLFSS